MMTTAERLEEAEAAAAEVMRTRDVFERFRANMLDPERQPPLVAYRVAEIDEMGAAFVAQAESLRGIIDRARVQLTRELEAQLDN